MGYRCDSDLGGIDDNPEFPLAGIERGVDQQVGAARLGTVGVYGTKRLFVVEDARPAQQLPAAGGVEQTPEQGDRPQILPPLTQHRVIPAQNGEQRYAPVGRMAGVETMGTCGAERTKAWQVEIGRIRLQPRPPGSARMGRTEHRLAQVAIGVAPIGQPVLLTCLRSGKRLLGAVIDAGNAEREELDRDAGNHLMVRGSVRGKTQFLAEDLVVVVENRYMLVAEVAVRPKRVLRRIEAVEIGARQRQTLGHSNERRPHLADVERGIEVAVENVEVTLFGEIAAGDLADQEEIVLTDIGSELFDRAAEVAGLL